jgi:hypothetical protein
MVIIGLVVLIAGIFWMAWGALPRHEGDPEANHAIRRGAILLPAGLALMFAGTPAAAEGVPRSVFALYVVVATLVTVVVVLRFSEDRPVVTRQKPEEPPSPDTVRDLATARMARAALITGAGSAARGPG